MLDIDAGIARPKIDMHTHVWRMPDWEKSADHLVDSARMLGITEVWSSSVTMKGLIATPEEVREHNDTTLEAMNRHPEFIRGWCFIIPGHVAESVTEAERCLDAGMIGIKLYNQYRINDPVVRPIIELAIERHIPILEHAGYPVAEHMALQPLISYGEHFTEVSQRYPEAMLVHAHIGGGGDWEHTTRQLRDSSPNVFIDVSGSVLDDGQIELALDVLGEDRILFGTDGTMAGSVGKVLDADLTEEQREKIFCGNAARILAAQGAVPFHVSRPPVDGGQQTAPGRVSSSSNPTGLSIDCRLPTAGGGARGGGTPLFDLNAWLGSFPFRSVPDTTPERLVARMDRAGITAAAVGSLEAPFHRHPQPDNERLAEQVVPFRDRLVPMACINPTSPGWEADLARCVDEFDMPGVRISPQYGRYPVDGPLGIAIAKACAGHGVPLFIPHRLEDQRQHHWMDPGKPLDLGTIASLIKTVPDSTIVVTNARGISRSGLWTTREMRDLEWYLDLSLAEIFYGLHKSTSVMRDLADMLDEGGASHLVFGTHQPFSYAGPALVKRAILPVDKDTLGEISHRCAARLLGLTLGDDGRIQS